MALALLLSVQTSILNGRAVWCSSRCFTYVASLQLCHRPMSNCEARTDCQHSTRRGAPCLWVSSPVCIHGHMDDVVQLSHPREIQYTSLTSFEVTRDSIQFCLCSCGRSCCLSHDFLRTEGNVEALFCQKLTDSSTCRRSSSAPVASASRYLAATRTAPPCGVLAPRRSGKPWLSRHYCPRTLGLRTRHGWGRLSIAPALHGATRQEENTSAAAPALSTIASLSWYEYHLHHCGGDNLRQRPELLLVEVHHRKLFGMHSRKSG